MARCTATSKRTGERCGAHAVTGRAVCHHHGGKTPAGVASPHFRHGRHSRRLPTRLAARIAEAGADPEWGSLRAEVALLDARIADLLLGLAGAGPGEERRRWAAVLRLLDQRRRLVEAERRRLVALGQMIPADEALALVAALTAAVRAHVRDPAALAAVAAEFARLLDRDGPGPTGVGDAGELGDG